MPLPLSLVSAYRYDDQQLIANIVTEESYYYYSSANLLSPLKISDED